jgi:hypothetical protein
MEMLILGVGSIVIALALLVLAVVLVILYSQVNGSSSIFSSPDVSRFLRLIWLATATMAVFFIVVALVALRSRRYLRDEPPWAVGPNQAVCAECGGAFNVHNMIAHNGLHVCARCKPIFLQKLAEG